MKKRIGAMLTALALVGAMLPSAMAAETNGEEYTATSDWITGSTNGAGDTVTITYTIPEGTEYSKITFPVFESAKNGFPIYDESGALLGDWTWVPGDSATIIVRVVDETGNYLYDSDSLWLGTKELDTENSREIVNRAYNQALYSLIQIQNDFRSENADAESQLTDEALGALLVNAGYENGIADLDKFYCDFFGVSSLDELDNDTVASLFSGKWHGRFEGIMYQATGSNETNSAVIELGWKNLYTNLFTVNNIGLLNYSAGSDALSTLDDTFESNVASADGVPLNIQIDGLKTGNAYQEHDIYMGLSFSMSVEGDTPAPGKEDKPSLEKTSNGNDYIGQVRPGDEVSFELTSNLPTSLANYVDENNQITNSDVEYTLTFHDVMSDGLSFNPDSLHVLIGETRLDRDLNQYTLRETPDVGDTFTLDLNLVALVNSGVISQSDLERAVSIRITYTATVGADALDQTQLSNEAWVNDSKHDEITGVPETGGSGTLMFTVGGAALLAAAGALFVVNRRKSGN